MVAHEQVEKFGILIVHDLPITEHEFKPLELFFTLFVDDLLNLFDPLLDVFLPHGGFYR